MPLDLGRESGNCNVPFIFELSVRTMSVRKVLYIYILGQMFFTSYVRI